MKANLSKIKFYNSVKSSFKGGADTELSFVDISVLTQYQISIDDVFIKIYNKVTKETSYTTISNVIFFTLAD